MGKFANIDPGTSNCASKSNIVRETIIAPYQKVTATVTLSVFWKNITMGNLAQSAKLDFHLPVKNGDKLIIVPTPKVVAKGKSHFKLPCWILPRRECILLLSQRFYSETMGQ